MNRSAFGIAAKERKERKEKRRQPVRETADFRRSGKCCPEPLLFFFAIFAFFCGSNSAAPPAVHLRDKTFVAWVQLANTTQRGGSVLTLEQRGGNFDALVFGELEPGRWMAGSELFKRTSHAQAAWPVETADAKRFVQIAASYAGKTVRLFRNGAEIANHEVAEPMPFDTETLAIIGKRHRTAGGAAFFAGAIDEARIYDTALDAAVLATLKPDSDSGPKPVAKWTFNDEIATDAMGTFLPAELRDGARIAAGRLMLDGTSAYLIAAPAAAPQTLPPPPFRSPVQYRPAGATLADTIPFFWKGTYHIFYLRAGHGGTPWAHIESQDLAHWRDLPDALPLGRPDEPDGGNVFTGSVIENAGVFHIFYTGFNPRHARNREHICHATSRDLIEWTKQPQDTFTADGTHYDNQHDDDFRDAFVFKNPDDGLFWMLLCARDAKDKRPVTGVAVSRDLVKWEQRDPLCDGYRGTPECPDLFRIGETWYLLTSPSEGVTTWRSAPKLAGPWSPAPGKAIDTPILYAAKRMWDGKRHILTGWERDLAGERDGGEFQWGGYQSLPREVYEVVPGELGLRPAEEARVPVRETVFYLRMETTLDGRTGGIGTTAGTHFTVPDDYHLDLHATLDDAATFTVGFRISGDGYRLTLHPREQEIAFTGPGMNFRRVCQFDPKLPVRVEAFVFGTLIEVFVNDRHAFSARAYNLRHGTLEVAVSGGTANITDLIVQTTR